MSDIGELIEGYVAMVKDTARELDAEEWSEGLVGDSFDADTDATSEMPGA